MKRSGMDRSNGLALAIGVLNLCYGVYHLIDHHSPARIALEFFLAGSGLAIALTRLTENPKERR